MFDQFLKKSAELITQGESFVTATVVRCQPPTSGKPGDKAIIHADGKIWGWIGGGCAQPVVVKEALKALGDGRPKLVRISPSATDPEEGIVDYTMTCHSGGALDIYLEPVLPKPRILILGRSPVARTLAQLGSTIGYAVELVSSDLATEGDLATVGDAATKAMAGAEIIKTRDMAQVTITPQTFVVVATQGEGDEEALEQAIQAGSAYIAFVASKTKASKVFEYLRTRGVMPERLSQVRAPAGVDIGARSPEEIAVSILAEIVQLRTSAVKAAGQPNASSALPVINTEARDPICGMTVDQTKAKYKTEFQGKMFYFCCARCKQTFEQNPQRYLAPASV
jgi:xanthine dehydrogenase accessory factor